MNYVSPLLQKKQNAQIATSGDSGEKQTNSNFQKYDKCPNYNLAHSGQKKKKKTEKTLTFRSFSNSKSATAESETDTKQKMTLKEGEVSK
jgi:hypothetical protein